MKRAITALVVVLALLAVSAPALAGGWAAVRLDEPPGDVPVGEPWRFGFTVLQHDVTPNSDVTPLVRAVNKETGEEITTTAVQEGPVGHFVAELTLPEAGEWKWEVTPEPFAATTFESLVVVDASKSKTFNLPKNIHLLALMIASRDPGKTETIEMLDKWTFSPAELEITAGTTVTWVNRSSVVHQVTGDDLAFEDSGLIEPGQSYRVTFSEPGSYRYHCSPHVGMEGVIVVT